LKDNQVRFNGSFNPAARAAELGTPMNGLV
jgi:hypothetical protein